jgi:hypothetical protein
MICVQIILIKIIGGEIMILKSYFDGIGTGAGVAWPLFGIIASAVSLSVGGLLTVILGTICSVLFLLVSAATFYISYRRSEGEERKLKLKLYENLIDFLDELHREAVECNQDFITFLNHWKVNNGDKYPFQRNFINFIQKKEASFLENYEDYGKEKKQAWLDKHLKSLISTYSTQITPLPFQERGSVGFLSFMGVFGSITGCSAGMMGVCVGLGLISGFSAIPIIGLSIVGVGLMIGLYAAQQAMISSTEKNAKRQIYRNFKECNHELNKQELDKLAEARSQGPLSSHTRDASRFTLASPSGPFFGVQGKHRALPHPEKSFAPALQ